MDESRLVELELRATRQQAMLEDLSTVLHEQGLELSALREQLRALRARLEQGDERRQAPANEPPPHY
jgi:SlyX protein